ncbi:FAD-dependent monooxygenase [Microbispora bryophytorum]|uniref:FAD-dependent monooxygenase n=1 Tax=Microbispora bryophytorum TaxID=1460882 RepID=UPI0034041371
MNGVTVDLKADFCVVGGGPAGLTLALLLARSGAAVVVAERSTSMEREYRGEILQPGGLRLLAELGVLDGARERGCHEHSRFRFVDRDRTLVDIDYRRLPEPFNYLLSIPQRHLIEELLAAIQRLGVTYLAGHRVSELIIEDGRIGGVVAGGPDRRQVVRAHCVVAADGRYSKTRQLAGIEFDRRDVFDHDVLWFKIPCPAGDPPDVRIFRAAGNPVLVYRSFPDSLQVGWTLPHKGYRAMAEQGVGHVKARIADALPPYAGLVDSTLSSLSDLTLLDVFSGTARRWAADGLVLIGDAAHTHSPIGAQGINLAVQDAVAVHPLLMASLRAGDPSRDLLGRYVTVRRRDVATIMRLQVMQSKAMLSQSPVAAALRPRAAKALSRTPVFRKVLHRLAYGNKDIRIAADLFVTD